MEESEIQQLGQQADEAIAALDVSAARKLLMRLDALGIAPEQGDAVGVMYRDLLFVRLPQLTLAQATWLLQHSVLSGLEIPDFDLLSRIADTLSVIFDEDERIAFANKLVEALEQGTEELGAQPFSLDGHDAPATVQ